MNTTREKDIQLGTDETINERDFEAKNVKQRITILVDEFVIEAFKAEAEMRGTKYQTLMREVLRDHVSGDSIEERVSKLEELMKKMA